MKLAILHGHICTANDDGTVPLDSRSLLRFNRFDKDEADGAAFLVESYNNLLEACEAFVKAARYLPPVVDSAVADAINRADAAIRKAKGEA